VWLVESDTSLARNHVPWTIIGVCHVVCIVTLLAIRWHLARENRRRDLEPRDRTYDDNWVEMVRDDGTVDKVKVPKVFTFGLCSIVCLMLRCRSTWISRIFKTVIFAMFCSSFLGLQGGGSYPSCRRRWLIRHIIWTGRYHKCLLHRSDSRRHFP